VPFYFINLLPTSLLYISILLCAFVSCLRVCACMRASVLGQATERVDKVCECGLTGRVSAHTHTHRHTHTHKAHTQAHTHTHTHTQAHNTCAEKLVNLGADLNVRNQLGSTALHYAAIEGHTVRVCGLGFRV
jgi:hypothetical protein